MRNGAIVGCCWAAVLAAGNLLHAQDLTVVSAAGAQSVVSPGSLATIYGEFGADPAIGQLNALGSFPTELAGFALDFNGLRAQLLFVGPEQINFLVPADAAFGVTNMNLTAPGRIMKATANVQPVAPAIFTMIRSGRELGAILNAVTFQLGPFRPDTPEIPGCDSRTRLAVYATGMGLATNRAKPRDVRVELQDASGSPVAADVEAAVPAPGFMGLDQVNVVLPSGLRPGTVLLRLIVNGLASNQVKFDLTAGSGTPASGVCLGNVTVSRAAGQSGGLLQGTVSLAYPAAIGGVGVSLTADNGVNVPGAVIVPEGLTATTFLVAVSSAAGQTFHVSASLNGSGRTATFDQGPACVNGLALSSDGIMSGMGLKGSIILSDPAPSAGVAVSLITANSLVTVTPTATVPAGQMSAPFDIKTAPTVNPSKATITAAGSCGGTSTDLNLVVVQCVSSVSLSAAAVTGGGNLTGTVKLNAPALAGGLLVTFSSSDPSVQVDNSVRVEEGQTTATFHANTRSVGSKTIVSVVATVGNCGSALATLTLMP